MAPQQKITKETLLSHAFKIAEKQGIMAVTSRSVAKSVGCSIQPVFSHFPTMEDLRQATFDYACDVFVGEVLVYEHEPDFFARVTKWTIELAKNRPHLFRLLYLSDGFHDMNFSKVMMGYESNKKMIDKMVETYSIDEDVCRDLLMRSCLFLVGIGTMICINKMDFTVEQVADMMKQTFSDMLRGARKEKP